MGSSISFAKELRIRVTETEQDLWYFLRAKRFYGLKFRRQHPIGPYIVDFVCLEKLIIIELDGGQHAEQKEKDQNRDQWLKKERYKVLRFWNHEFYENREMVLEQIYLACFGHPPPTPSPQGRGDKNSSFSF